MPRPPLPRNNHGTIRCYPNGNSFRAVTNFRNSNGVTKPIERSGPTEAKAKANLRRALRDRQEKRTTLTSTSRFRDVALAWLEDVANDPEVADSSVVTYRRTLKNQVLDRIGGLRLPELSVPTLEEFFAELRDEGHTANYRRSIRTVVRGPLSFAIRKGLLERNPVHDLSPIKGKGKKVRSLTPEERLDMLDRLDADEVSRKSGLPDLVRFMLGTGCRVGEALALRWCDCNLTDTRIYDADGDEIPPVSVSINGNIVDVTGKGLQRHNGKTENSDRILKLPAFLAMMLTIRRPAGSTDDEPVFPSGRLTWKHPNNVRRSLREAWERIEAYAWVHPHVFRKTAATILDDSRLSARQIADVLGHANPELTLRTYMGRGHLSDAAADALDAAYAAN